MCKTNLRPATDKYFGSFSYSKSITPVGGLLGGSGEFCPAGFWETARSVRGLGVAFCGVGLKCSEIRVMALLQMSLKTSLRQPASDASNAFENMDKHFQIKF